MLEKEFKYYISHQDELVKKYNGKVIAIIGEEVVGSYDSFEKALSEAQKKYKLGSFFIQQCNQGENNYTQRFHSRVTFG